VHIPDGYISPASAAVMYGAAAPFWWLAGQKVKRVVSGQAAPLLAIFAAFSFTVMMFNIPVPGGTTAHAVGGTLAAIVLGPWAAVIVVSVALVIQALFFGDGGITAIGANCFNMAIVLPIAGYLFYRLISRGAPVLSRRRLVAAGIGSYIGINLAGFLVALELGIQPVLWSDNGRALYAPYHFSKTIPAMMIAHLTVAGAAEVIATVFALAYIQRVHPYLLEGKKKPATVATGPKRSWQVPAIAAAIVLLVPLGLLSSGSAWGEWASGELGQRKDVGYVPSGLHKYEGIWHAPFSGYTMPWVPNNPSFSQEAFAYILAAVVGLALIFTVVFALKVLSKRTAAGNPSPSPAWGD
jgi:cobalt/nickel transport system permease protein